jgi:hypothetical protein
MAEAKQTAALIGEVLFRGLRWLWLAAAILAVGLFLLGLGPLFGDVKALTGSPPPNPDPFAFLPMAYRAIDALGISPVLYGLYQIILQSVVFGLYMVIAGLIFWRRPRDRFALLVCYMLLSMGLLATSVSVSYGLARFDPGWSRAFDAQAGSLWFFAWAFLFVFPDGRFVPRWNALVAGLFIFAALLPNSPPLFILILATLAIVAQAYRYLRVSTPIQRQQTKWVVLGLALFVAITVLLGPDVNNLPLPYWTLDLASLSLAIFPVAFGISILKAGLWDVDVIIRRTLIYGILTTLLAMVYFGTVALLQNLFAAASGEQSPLAIVISTLVIAAMFQPLRRRLQALIDRRFYRRKYDAAQALGSFAVTARDEVDLERLTAALLTLVDETMQPEHVSLWLRDVNTREGTAPE